MTHGIKQKALLGAAAIAMSAAVFQSFAQAQTPAPGQPGVMAMEPIADSASDATPATDHEGPGPAGPAYLSTGDHVLFTRAFAAADAGNWAAARSLAATGTNETAKQIVEWRYLLDERGGATFDAIDAFLRAHPKWPRRQAMLTRAEKTMPENLDPSSVRAWYGNRDPVSGYGEMRLGEAMMATGRVKDGIDHIRHAWISNPFAPADEAMIEARHRDLLSAEVQQQRLDRLLWDNDIGGAKRQMPRVDSTAQKLANARMAIKSNPSNAAKVTSGLPTLLRQDPGLLFDTARALRRSGKDDQALPIVLKAPTGSDMGRPDLWWAERVVLARDAMQARQYQTAYDLISKHGMSSGSDFADAEFLAGWIKLRYLNDAVTAEKHFRNLARGVSYPISRSRAYYWLGRALEAQNKLDAAVTNYQQAAQDSTTFYGQLALARIEDNPILKLRSNTPDTKDTKDFNSDDRVSAMRVLADLGEFDMLRAFVIATANDENDPRHLALLAETMTKLRQPALAIKVAKLASYQDVTMIPHLDPVISIPRFPGSGDAPEPALVLGITRQESEFDPGAVSPAGARGLMQIMPASAKLTAGQHGMSYRLDQLIADPNYNMQVGQAHLADFIKSWSGSYVLAIASYNAGPGNVRKWIETNGDPRNPDVDPVDWIELIPFGETRNYVQRVLENTQVYRNRLSGKDQPLTLLADLYRPNAPRGTVVKYVPPGAPQDNVPVPKPAPEHAAAKTPSQTAQNP